GLTVASRAFLMRGDIARARRVLERSLKLKHDQPDAAKMLAAIYLAAGDDHRGVELLEEAARWDPSDFRPWYALANAYRGLGRLDQSVAAYGEALRRKPPEAEARAARIGRIQAELDANLPDEASADLAVVQAQTPDDPQVLALAARQARELGHLDEA